MWQPTPRQMELIIEHAVAHMPASTTARMLGIEPEALATWAAWLEKGRAARDAPPAPAEAAQAPLLVPETASPALLEVP